MHKIKILVADDEQVFVNYIEFALEHWDYQVITASDGNETLKKAIMEKPDAILLDIHMPDMDGPEICAKLKENPQTSDIPILFITGMLSKEIKEDIGLSEAVDCIEKPFDFNLLQNKLGQIFERRKLAGGLS